MKKLGILVGEDADLPKDKIKNLPISVFPFIVNWKEHKTSQPSVKTLKELFTKNLKKYKELLVITISSLLSGTYNSAVQTKNLLDKDNKKRIQVIDSKISTAGEGLIVLRIAELIKLRKSKNEVLSEINKCIPNTYLLGAFDDPYYLESGGRINRVQSLVIKNMLKAGFRPILTIKDGKIVTKKIRRERNKANALFRQFKEEISSLCNNGNISVAITHADCEKDANELKKLVQSFSKNIKIEFVNTISPVVGMHLGQNSLIISWVIN